MSEMSDALYKTTYHQISYINGANEPIRRAVLAKLRRGAGKTPGELPEIFEYTVGALPEMNNTFDREHAEWAIHAALTLYALHKQGADNVITGLGGQSFGTAVSCLRVGDNAESVTKRFNAAVTSDTILGLSVHIRGIVQMLRGKGVDMDYHKFAKELYFWQKNPERTRLSWGRDYWKNSMEKAPY